MESRTQRRGAWPATEKETESGGKRERWGGRIERGEHWFYFSLTLKSPVKVSSSPSVTYTCMQLARWTHARCILQHVRWSLLLAFNWWRTKSPQWRQARERITGERETDQHNTGKIRVSLMTQSTAPLPFPLPTLTTTTFSPHTLHFGLSSHFAWMNRACDSSV